MRAPPPGWSRINASIFYDDAAAAIDFLCDAFGFERVMVIEGEGGRVEHSELRLGDNGLVMVGSAGGGSHREGGLPAVSPRAVNGQNTSMLCVFVDDADAHAARAEAAG
ncbi:MAG: VOC family protein, partial [Myxococcales bacterium]|nr:VOC family protein [Myxococcales bacterium]